MIDFMLGCFDLLFGLTSQVSNILIILPFCALIVSILLSLTFKIIRGDFK